MEARINILCGPPDLCGHPWPGPISWHQSVFLQKYPGQLCLLCRELTLNLPKVQKNPWFSTGRGWDEDDQGQTPCATSSIPCQLLGKRNFIFAALTWALLALQMGSVLEALCWGTDQAVRAGTGSCPGFPKSVLGSPGELGEC